VRLTEDLTAIVWLSPDKEDKEPDPDEKLHALTLNDIMACADGAKTGLMKKMNMRAEAGGSIFEKMLGLRPYDTPRAQPHRPPTPPPRLGPDGLADGDDVADDGVAAVTQAADDVADDGVADDGVADDDVAAVTRAADDGCG
jgi:hypothetical protein